LTWFMDINSFMTKDIAYSTVVRRYRKKIPIHYYSDEKK
jgi:hypothetical protein